MNNHVSALEAILFAAGEPVNIARISLVLQQSEDTVLDAFQELNEIFESEGHGIRAVRLGEKLQLCSLPEYADIISRTLESRKPPALSPAALETLSIVAYYQPATQAYVNKLRGVDSSYSIGSLCDKGLIESKGHLDVPGRPLLYVTTDLFLRTMGISSLKELPPLPDMQQNGAIEKLMSEIESLKPSSDVVTPIPGQTVIGESD